MGISPRAGVTFAGSDEATPAAAGGTDAPATAASDAAVSTPDKKVPQLGWQGSRYKNIVDGVHEHREAIAKRKRLRLLPEINRIISQLWTIGTRRGARMDLRAYMDFHRSCFFFVSAIEEQMTVDDVEPLVEPFEAWENGVCDWKQDTETMLELYGSRTLHFDSFRDSVFELIDLYTPTTDEKQYIGYLRKLVRQIAVVDGNGVPIRWRHPWSSANGAKKLAMAIRDMTGAQTADALHARFASWLKAQEDARTELVRAEAIASGLKLSEGGLHELLDVWEELMPSGLWLVCEGLAEGEHASLPAPLEDFDPEDIVGLVRVLDIDCTGGVSRDDLVKSLLDKVQSPWLKTTGSFLRGVALASSLRSSKKPSSTASSPKASRSPQRTKGEKSPGGKMW